MAIGSFLTRVRDGHCAGSKANNGVRAAALECSELRSFESMEVLFSAGPFSWVMKAIGDRKR